MKYRRNGRTLLIRRLVAAAGMLIAAVTLAGCEQFFTTSPFSFLQRDPSNLSPEQQISYARLSLESGDTETQRNAYEAIKDRDDPEVQLLASKVALGASGIMDAVGSALEGESVSAEDIDMDMLKNSVDAMEKAEEGGAAISSEDYIAAAAGAVVYAVEGNSETLPSDWGTVTSDKDSTSYIAQAKYYQEQSGYTEDDIDQLSSSFGL